MQVPGNYIKVGIYFGRQAFSLETRAANTMQRCLRFAKFSLLGSNFLIRSASEELSLERSENLLRAM
jgi:hypothetical protein